MSRTDTVILIGCGSRKRPGMHDARDLYTGSLFRAARRYAEESGCPWYILSAKWGVLTPTSRVESYDYRLERKGTNAWHRSARLMGDLLYEWVLDFHGTHPGPKRLVVLAGEPYVEWLKAGLGLAWNLAPRRWWTEGQWSLETPLSGLGLGQRLQWLAKHRALAHDL